MGFREGEEAARRMGEIGYRGKCHCGAIGFHYKCAASPAQWSVRACQCRFCRAHDALSTSDPASHIVFEAPDPAQLQRYRFGLKTADFLLCRNCGVYIGAVIETPNGRFGIINTRALTPQPDNCATALPMTYDGEAVVERVVRREDRWSPVSVISW